MDWLETERAASVRRLPHGGVYAAKWVLVTRRSTVSRQPELCREILAAYQAAIHRIERKPEAMLRLHGRRAGVPVSRLQARWSGLDYDLHLDWSVISSLQLQFHWARRTGRVPADAAGDVLSLIEDGPLRRVAPASVGIPADGGRVGSMQ